MLNERGLVIFVACAWRKLGGAVVICSEHVRRWRKVSGSFNSQHFGPLEQQLKD